MPKGKLVKPSKFWLVDFSFTPYLLLGFECPLNDFLSLPLKNL